MFETPTFDPGLLRLDHSVTVDRVRGGLKVAVPLRLPAGRDGLGPSLALIRSGSGPSPFGRGWALSGLPFIGIDTRDGLPSPGQPRSFADTHGNTLVQLDTRQDGDHQVETYALEIDESRERFERWIASDGQDHWQVRSPEGRIHIFGREHRIHAAGDPSDTWRWLLEQVVDEVGNAMQVEYRAEDARNVPESSPAERERLFKGDFPQRYPQRILYGNTRPIDALSAPDTEWRFSVVFDWGDHQDTAGISTGPSGDWPARSDPFSTHRAGYEIRSWRLCRRILVVHDFPELGGPRIVGAHVLTHALSPAGAELESVHFEGKRWDGSTTTSIQTPALRFTTSPPNPESTFEDTELHTDGQWVDLLGTGLPGLLRKHVGAWLFRENLGQGSFAPESVVPALPRHVAAAVVADSNGDGNVDLSQLAGRSAGHYKRDRHSGQWSPYAFFQGIAHTDPIKSRAQWVDLSGDGRPDLVVDHGDRLVWFPSLGEDGHGTPRVLPHPAGAPNLRQSAQHHSTFADMTGDGLADLVQLSPGRVVYWPNQGHGRFGAPVEMENAPTLDDLRRVIWADTQRTGTADLVIIGERQVLLYANQRGNGFAAPQILRGVPHIDRIQDLRIADFYGDGGRCLIWRRPGRNTQVLRLDQGAQAGRLATVQDGAGLETQISWRSSAQDFLRDAPTARPWRTLLPHHQVVVASLIRREGVSGASYQTDFSWKDGHFDDHRRSFVGFGQVESGPPADPDDPSPRALTRSWIRLGVEPRVDREQDFYAGDSEHMRLEAPQVQSVSDPAQAHRALRALEGHPWREEVFALAPDGSLSEHPLSTSESTWIIQGRGPSLRPIQTQQLRHDYQERPTDPQVQHQLLLAWDEHGSATRQATVRYPRRIPEQLGQEQLDIELSEQIYAQIDTPERLLLNSLVSQRRVHLDAPSPNGQLAPDSAVFEGPSSLVSASRTHYWNVAQDGIASGVALPRLVHHVDAAVFPEGADYWEGQVDSAGLEAAGYLLEEGLWWAPGGARHSSGSFHRLARQDALDSSEVTLTWDADQLFTVGQTNEVGLTWTRQIDPQSLQAGRIEGPNGTIALLQFDGLAQVLSTTLQGTRTGMDGLSHPEGGESEWATLPLADALTDPHTAIGHASQATLYDATRWERGEGPVCWLALTRLAHRNDGEGGLTDGQAAASLSYVDGFGQEVQARSLAAPGPAIDADGAVIQADPRWHVSGHSHRDGLGQVVRQYEPFFSETSDYQDDPALQSFGQALESTWDSMGRQIATLRPDGTQTRQDHSPWTTETNDANDLVLGSAWETQVSALPSDDPLHQALRQAQSHAQTPVVQHLDGRGRIIAVTESNGSELRQERTVYGPHDAPLSQEDARGLVAMKWERDLAGRALVEDSIDGGTQRIFLDALNRERSRWTASAEEISSTWDLAGRPLERRVDGRLVEKWDYSEDAETNSAGRLHQRWDGAGLHQVSRYDMAGQALETSTALRVQTGSVDWDSDTNEKTSFTNRFLYDALGRSTWKSLPDGSERSQRWDPLGQATQLAATLDGVAKDYIEEADYNARGQRSRVLYGNGVQAEWTFDSKSFRLATLSASSPSRSYVDIRYTWDPVGNLVHMVDRNQDPGVSDALLQGANVSAAQSFSYDAFYRLKSATGRVHQALLPYESLPGSHSTGGKGTQHLTLNNGAALERYTRSYDYDLAGNLLKTRHQSLSGAWTRALNVSTSSNRSVLSVGPSGLPTTDVDSAFDSAGRRSSLPNLRAMDWDHAGQLLRAVILERETGDDDEVYTYDAGGQRVRRVTQRKVADHFERIETVYLHGCERRRVYSGDTLILERWTSRIQDAGQQLAMVHRWTLDTRGRESADLSARIHYQVGNHLGSVSLELDESGAIISYEEYLPYGGSAFIAGDRAKEVDLKEYRYSGKIRDDATGLYYYGYRYYAVWIGNWLSADPAGAVDGLNLYRFVRNNPMRFVDPNGLETFDSWGVTYDPETWTPEQVKAHYNASGGENVITGEVRLIGGRWVPSEFTAIPSQPGVEDQEIAMNAGVFSGDGEALLDLSGTGIAGLIGTDGKGDAGEGGDGEDQEGQDGGQGEAQEGEAAGETGTGDQGSKQGDPDGDPEGTDPESEATSSNSTDTGEQPPGTEERQGNTDQAVPPPPMGAPLSEDGQAYSPANGHGGQGQAGDQVSVGNGTDPGGVPPDEAKQGEQIERTWLDSAVEIAGYLNLEFGEGAPEGDRYGVPGGWLGWIPGSRVTQGIFVAVSAVMAVITVIELAVGIGEAKLAAKAGIAAIRTFGVKGAVKLFWDGALKKAAALGGMLLKRNKDEAAEGVVGYGATDLSRAAIEFRRAEGIKGARNVAVFEYVSPGGRQLLTEASERGVGHAERIIARQLDNLGVDPSKVRRIYSELEPCSVPGGYCAAFIDRTFPQAKVTFSFQYGATRASRQSGVAALRQAVKKVFGE